MDIDVIVVGVDGSHESWSAVQWSADLARSTGAVVVVVHSVGLLEHLRPDGAGSLLDDSVDPEVRIGGLMCEPWTETLDIAGIPKRCIVRDGPPVDALLRTADEQGADLLVVGRTGTGSAPALLLGSTSSQLAQRAATPVVVVPGAPRPQLGGGR